MAAILNFTPMPAARFVFLDQYAQPFDLIVVCATFEARPGRHLRIAEKQNPIRQIDVHYGKPEASSVRYEADIALEKQAVDVIVHGRAFAPRGVKVERLRVSIQIGKLQKELQVTGDRFWNRGFLGTIPSSPRPFESMPLVYERAFGGSDSAAPQHREARNPVGVGFRGSPSQDPDVQTELPNIEYPSQLVTSPLSRCDPAGFGVIARSWQPRLSLAGTYDTSWQEEQWPLLPHDFDPLYFQATPRDQQLVSIQGGEKVELVNMTPEGLWQFTLPALNIPIRLRYPHRGGVVPLRVDTLLLEPHEYRFTLSSRAKVPVNRHQGPLQEVIVGHVTRGWWRARRSNKVYRDWAGNGGRVPNLHDDRLWQHR